MLEESLKSEIRAAYQQLVSGKALTPRWGQRQMIAEISLALGDAQSDTPIAVVEAGTGTGKTIAYVIAGLICARARGKKLVLATATVALQEQLVSKDLPDILAHSGLSFSVQLAKGRGRYVCLNKLDQHLSGQHTAALIPLYPDEMVQWSPAEATPVYEAMVQALMHEGWEGDLDTWPVVLEEPLRRSVTTDHLQCAGRRCPHISQCSFFKARDGLLEADVIVANHDLVLSDLKLGGGAILPPPEECFFVFDEGHQLPDKCLNHFMLSARYGSATQSLADAQLWLSENRQGLIDADIAEAVIDGLLSSIVDINQCWAEAAVWLWETIETEAPDSGEWRFPMGVIPEPLVDLAGALVTQWRDHLTLTLRLEAGIDAALRTAERSVLERLEAWLGNAATLVSRARTQTALWGSYADAGQPQRSSGVGWARWIRHRGSEASLECLASPILADKLLLEHVWKVAGGAVVTSATLTALGSFERLIQRTGIPRSARFKQVNSPFDTQRARFVVPQLRAEPSDAQAHTDEIVDRLPTLIAKDRGVLMLFSSRRQMEAVREGLEGQIPHTIWVQDTLSKGELLRRHRECIDNGGTSLLLGLASFAEGIDLPGSYCEHVVIAKLPFAVPDNPLDAAHAEWMEQQGRNAFMEISVPDAALRLLQASGRLLRTEKDAGTITLLDKRVLTKRYGRAILDSLPRFDFDLAGQ